MTELFVPLLNIEVTVNIITKCQHKQKINEMWRKIGASVNAELEYGMEQWTYPVRVTGSAQSKSNYLASVSLELLSHRRSFMIKFGTARHHAFISKHALYCC